MTETNPYPTRDFSDRDLIVSSFIVRHRETLRLIGLGILLLVDTIFVGLFVFNIYKYAVTYEETERAIIGSSVLEIDWTSIRAATAPTPLGINNVQILPAGEQTDFVARITNVNENRWSAFEYRFVWGGGSSEWTSTFILPQDEKYLMALGNPVSGIGSVQFETRNVSWKPIPQLLRDRFMVTRDTVVVVSSRFIPNINENLTGVPNSGVEFVVRNDSPFNYQDIAFNVIVTNGIEITAVNRATLATLERDIERSVRTRWFRLVGGGQVLIQPDINYLDDAIIAPEEDSLDATF